MRGMGGMLWRQCSDVAPCQLVRTHVCRRSSTRRCPPCRELASKAAEAQRLALQLRKAGEERASKEVQDEVEELKKERSNLLGRLKRVRWWW